MPVFFPEARVILQVVFETFGELDRPRVFPVRARNVSIHANSYNEADTFTVDFDANVGPDGALADAANEDGGIPDARLFDATVGCGDGVVCE